MRKRRRAPGGEGRRSAASGKPLFAFHKESACKTTASLVGEVSAGDSLWIQSVDLFSFYFTLFLTPLFLFSDVFFPIAERLSGFWLGIAECLPLLHPVRLARASFAGSFGWIALWDMAYIALLSGLLARISMQLMRRRLTS